MNASRRREAAIDDLRNISETEPTIADLLAWMKSHFPVLKAEREDGELRISYGAAKIVFVRWTGPHQFSASENKAHSEVSLTSFKGRQADVGVEALVDKLAAFAGS